MWSRALLRMCNLNLSWNVNKHLIMMDRTLLRQSNILMFSTSKINTEDEIKTRPAGQDLLIILKVYCIVSCTYLIVCIVNIFKCNALFLLQPELVYSIIHLCTVKVFLQQTFQLNFICYLFISIYFFCMPLFHIFWVFYG